MPTAEDRTGAIIHALQDLYRGDHLDMLATLNVKDLARGIASPIPIHCSLPQLQLWTTDNDALVEAMLNAPTDPRDRGEFIFATAIGFYNYYAAMPISFQQLLDGYLVKKRLLPPFRAKYL